MNVVFGQKYGHSVPPTMSVTPAEALDYVPLWILTIHRPGVYMYHYLYDRDSWKGREREEG